MLEEQMGKAGISTARFVHENGDVTFSFSADDRDAVEHILSAQREENPFADVEKWAADYQRQTQTAIAALEPEQRRIVDAMPIFVPGRNALFLTSAQSIRSSLSLLSARRTG